VNEAFLKNMLLMLVISFVFFFTMILPRLIVLVYRHSSRFLIFVWFSRVSPSVVAGIFALKVTPLVALLFSTGAWLALEITECVVCELDSDSLKRDLRAIGLIFPLGFFRSADSLTARA